MNVEYLTFEDHTEGVDSDSSTLHSNYDGAHDQTAAPPVMAP